MDLADWHRFLLGMPQWAHRDVSQSHRVYGERYFFAIISDDGGPGICLRCLDDIKLHFTYLYKTQEAQNASNNESP